MSPTAAPPWRVEHRQGPAGVLLAQSLEALRASAGTAATGTRLVRVLQIDRPALLLGSGQSESDVDAAAADREGVQVVRRSTGGGAVLVDPDGVLWVDLIIPASDPLWDSDLRRAPWWLGDAWAAAVDQIGAGPAHVWRGGMQPSDWSKRVCFAGLGPGEVTVGSQKVVGISQRRTRPGVLFQTAALLRWEPAALVALLAVDEAARAGTTAELQDLAAGVGTAQADALTAALLAALPDSSPRG